MDAPNSSGMDLSKSVAGLRMLQKNLSKSSLCSQDEASQTLGEDCGQGKILIAMRYKPSISSMDVRIVKADGLPSSDPAAPKPSTYCTVSFLPDETEPVSTATVNNSNCPRWRGAFRFEKFPFMSSVTSQRCLLAQVHNAATGAVTGEATLMLGNWTQKELEGGIAVWKYLSSPLDAQGVGDKAGSAFLTLHYKPDRFRLTLHRVEDIDIRWTAATESPAFHMKVQALKSGKIVKERSLPGLRCCEGDANFYDGQFSVRLSENGHGVGADFVLRLVLTHQVGSSEQELYWVDLGYEAKRFDCRRLFQSVLENTSQSHMVVLRLNKPPVAVLSSVQQRLQRKQRKQKKQLQQEKQQQQQQQQEQQPQPERH